MSKNLLKSSLTTAVVSGFMAFAVAPAALSQVTNASLHAELSGDNVVPAHRRDRGNVGDPNGSGEAFIFPLQQDEFSLCVSMTFENIDTTSPGAEALVYEGRPGKTGTVAAVLPAPDADGQSAGCIYEGNRSQFPTGEFGIVQRILSYPGKFYVGVNTAEFPSGAIRGQLVDLNQPEEPIAGNEGKGSGKTKRK